MRQVMKKAKAIAVFFMAIAYLGCEDVTNLFPDVVSAFTYTIDSETGVVTFINISEEADTYLWTFGDGDSSTEINPVKAYAASGTYTVTLKAMNVAGASDTSEDAVTINLPVVLEDVTLPITFDDPDVDYTPEAFGGTSFAVVDNPDVSGSNDKATKVGAITNSGAAFEGIFFDLGEDIDLTTEKSITMNFWADAPVDLLLKLEEGTAAAIETTVSHGGTGWETTTFDFTSSDQYSRLTLFVDGPGTTAGTFYIDDVEQAETSTGGGGGPIAPTAGPAAPTQDAADVISIFSDTYTDVPNEGFNNYGSAAFEQVDLAGNAALKYTFAAGGGGNFQVIELGGANQIDAAAAGMTNFRFDIWFPNEVDASSAFLMKVVDIPGSGATEAQININDSSTPPIEQGTWLSFDIPITELQANGLGGTSNIQQVVIDLVTSGEVYIDNIYFYKPSSGGGGPIAPTAGPAAPTQDAADVISIFSDTYTDVPNSGFNNYGAADFEVADLGGNAALRYTFNSAGGENFQVIELGGANQIDAAAAGMTNFRFDIWFPNEVDASSAFLMKVVDIPGSGATEAQININDSSTPPIEQGTWLSFDIPITELQANGLGGTSNIQQVVIDLVTSGEAYIDNIYFYKPAGGGGPIAPTAGPAAPTQDPADVISIFSDSYTDVPNSGFNNYGAADFEVADLGGNAALRYTFNSAGGGNFQVIELGGANQIDAAAAGMTNFRFDIWFPNEVDASSAFLMKVVDIPGSGATEAQININQSSTPPMSQGSWLSFDIPITELQANGLGGTSNIQQVVIDLVNSGEAYIDNIYFYKPAGSGGGTAPTTSAPVPPARDPGDVISIFSDSYTNITGVNYDPNWGQSGHMQVNTMYDPGDGNFALAYPNFNYQGTDFAGNAQDASAMEFLHVDMWTANATDVKVTPINGSGAPTESLQTLSPITSGQWVSYDIPLTDFTASGMTLNQIIQMKFDGQAGTTPSDIYLDNIYFYRAATGGTAPTTSAPVPPARDPGDVISIFSDSYTNITGVNYDPNWGQSGHMQVNTMYDPGDGNFALAYPNFNYQGTDFSGNAQDASAMEFLHVDMWTPDATVVQVTPINGSGAPTESLQSLTPINTGQWNSYDIPLTDFTASGMTLNQIIQMKFDGQAGVTPSDIYLDNIYFYRAASGGGGGGNLAANGDFETGAEAPWLLFQNGGTAALDNTVNNTSGGTWSGRLATGGPSNPAFKQERIGAGTVAATDVVQVQFDHIGSVTQPGAVFNVILFGEGASGASFTHVFNPAPSLSGTWTTFTGTFTIPGGTDVSEGISFLIEAVCGGDPGCSVTANIDNVSVTLNP